MTTGPLFIIGAGVWLLCQVFGGNALGRLGILAKDKDEDEDEETPPTGTGEFMRNLYAPNDLRVAGQGATDAGKLAGQAASDAFKRTLL